jgi:abortive infection bacteriophage resistance protein
MTAYNQPSLTVEQQLELLISKGLVISNKEFALSWLSNVSYFRLKTYSYFFKDYQNSNGNFIPDTSFEDIINLYTFDRKLKLIIFDAIEAIEIAVRTRISNTMSCKYGSHWYLNAGLFTNDERKFDHSKFISDIKKDCENPEETFITNYMKFYKDPELPPSWMIMEILSFGKISLLFEHLTAREEKNQICSDLGLPNNILPSWLHTFTYLRNLSAHHTKILNRTFTIKPILPTRRKLRFLTEADSVNNAKVYCSLCCIEFLLNKIHETTSFKKNLLTLTIEYPQIDLSKLGFTENWKKESVWQ